VVRGREGKNTKKGNDNWISGAVSEPGAFSEKAKKAGMSTREYAAYVLREGSKASDKTKKQARLALTLMKLGKKKK